MQQSCSPSSLMLTSRVVKPSPTFLSSKALITEASLVQVSSLSSEEHVNLSGDELDFGYELAPLDTSKFTYISEKETQVDVPAMVLPAGEFTTTVGISSIPVFFFICTLS